MIGWFGTEEAYCRNVNPPNVLQLEEEQGHFSAFRAQEVGGEAGGEKEEER